MRTVLTSLISLISILSINTWGAETSAESYIKAVGLDPKDVSMLFVKEDGTSLGWKEKQYRTPASVTKILTAAMAFEYLGHDYKWKSSLQSAAKVSDSTLKGDLCFYGGGNPSFLTEQLWVLSNHFLRNKILKVEGDLIVDESYFDSEYFDDKRMKKRVLRAYDSPVSGASFNWNSVNIYVRPGLVVGSKAEIYLDPQNDYTPIKNKVTTVGSGKTYIDIKRNVKNGVEEFEVSGRIQIQSGEKVFYRPIQKPHFWTGYNVKKQLSLLGVKIEGGVKKGVCAARSRVLAEVESKDFSLVVRDLMKFSNNFIAEMLAKTMVREVYGKQGSMDLALKLADTFLKERGSKEHKIYSLSGLSYQNRMRAVDILSILERRENDFGSFAEFLAAFPISGIDGTLKSRLKKKMYGRVRAKTGLLNSVAGLAGYGLTDSKKHFRFVLISNGNRKKESWKIRQAFDKMVINYAKKN